MSGRQDDELFARIKTLVSWHRAVKEAKLTLETRLGEDLSMDGDDAEEFLSDFKVQFHVDMSDFEFDRYFGPEAPFNPFAFLGGQDFARKKRPLLPVSLSNLVASAKAGKWQGA